MQRFPDRGDRLRAVLAEADRQAQAEPAPREPATYVVDGARESAEVRAQPQPLGEVPKADLPQHVARYRVERLLGEGGFGRVYLAHDEQLQRPVAIKVPHARLVARAEDAEAYLAKARVLASLEHPHIVPVYDVGSTEDCPCYFVMKYVEGTKLDSRIQHGPIPWAEGAEIVAKVAYALHYAHKSGLVHRDVKPGNILVDARGDPLSLISAWRSRNRTSAKVHSTWAHQRT